MEVSSACPLSSFMTSRASTRFFSGSGAMRVRSLSREGRSVSWARSRMMISRSRATVLLLLLFAPAGPFAHSQARSHRHHPARVAAPQAKLANEVRAEFLHAWNGYKKYAWGHDDLKPLSKTYHDLYAEPLLMTPVDALDTMILIGLRDEATTTREYIASHLSFD